jgi:hypothetical protein
VWVVSLSKAGCAQQHEGSGADQWMQHLHRDSPLLLITFQVIGLLTIRK